MTINRPKSTVESVNVKKPPASLLITAKHKFTLFLHVLYRTENWHGKIIMLYLLQVKFELENLSATFIGSEDYAVSEKWQKSLYVF
jgi:hypothetical protein